MSALAANESHEGHEAPLVGVSWLAPRRTRIGAARSDMLIKQLALVSVSLVAFAFCSRPQTVRQISPSDVVTAFYTACNDAKYADAEALITPESLKVLKSTFGLSGGLKGYCDSATENHTLQSVEIVSQQSRSEGTDIRLILHRKSGNDQDIHETLTHSAGAWKIHVGG